MTGLRFYRSFFAATVMVLAAAVSAQVRPVADPAARVAPDLEALMPDAFGIWTRIPLSEAVLPAESERGPGEAISYRSYKDDLGRVVTVVAAYGPPLGDSVRLHRPETCYVAQGFTIEARRLAFLSLAPANARPLKASVVHLLTKSPARNEVVTYWLRSGSDFVTEAPAAQLMSLRQGFAQLDGALIRVSSNGADDVLFSVHERFMKDFATALSAEGAHLFIGTPLTLDTDNSVQSHEDIL